MNYKETVKPTVEFIKELAKYSGHVVMRIRG